MTTTHRIRRIVWDVRNLIHRLTPKPILRRLPCHYCGSQGSEGCDCGAGPHLDYEIAAGRHERFCMAYNGCPACGRDQ